MYQHVVYRGRGRRGGGGGGEEGEERRGRRGGGGGGCRNYLASMYVVFGI